MKPQSCAIILAILNAMTARVSGSLSQIEDATRGLWPEEASRGSGVSVIDGSVITEEQGQ